MNSFVFFGTVVTTTRAMTITNQILFMPSGELSIYVLPYRELLLLRVNMIIKLDINIVKEYVANQIDIISSQNQLIVSLH